MKLFIHIGLPKTGTSYIQTLLSAKREALKSENIYYYDITFTHKSFLQNKVPDFDTIFKNIEKAVPSNATCIVSSEILSGFACISNLQALPTEDIAKPLFKAVKQFDTKVIAYIRRPDLWIESMYTHTICADYATMTFQQYLEHNKLLNRNIYDVIDCYASHFSPDNIIVKIYDKKYLPKRNSLAWEFGDLLSSNTLKNVPSDLFPLINPSYNRLTAEIARLCNMQSERKEAELPTIRKMLRNASFKIDKFDKIYFSKQQRAALLKYYQPTLKKIGQRYSNNANDISNFFSKPTEPEPSFLSLQDNFEDVLKIIFFSIASHSPKSHVADLKFIKLIELIEARIRRCFGKSKILEGLIKILGIKEKTK